MSNSKTKKIAVSLLSVLAIFIFTMGFNSDASIKKRADKEVINRTRITGSVFKFEFEGHSYLESLNGGIIHLESCTCKRLK